MASFNRVVLVGNLTRDPELKYTPKGTPVAQIGLAVNRVYSNEAGEKVEEVTFIDVELWSRSAEVVGQYCKKGRPVLIEGRLKMDTWDDKATGQKRSKLKVVGEVVQLLGSRENSGGGGGGGGGGEYDSVAPEVRTASASQQQRRPAAPPRPPADPDLDTEADDIPF